MVEASRQIPLIPSSSQIVAESDISTKKLYRNEDFLRQKYCVEKLSARQIAVLIGCAHSAVNRAIQRFDLDKHLTHSGWIEYGFKMEHGKIVAHVREQITISRMVRWRDSEWSFQRIAAELNQRGIRTPAGKGRWYGPTVKRIIARSMKGQSGRK